MEHVFKECKKLTPKQSEGPVQKDNIRQSQSEVFSLTLPKAREIVSVVIGFCLVPDWLRGWNEILTPVLEQTKQNQHKDNFDTQLNYALLIYLCSPD